MNTLERLTTDSEHARWMAIFNGALVFFMAICAQATWYQQCYINSIVNNSNFTNYYPFTGFYCTISGFVMMVVYAIINAMLPGYVPPTYSTQYNSDNTFYPPTAVPGPPLVGKVISVTPPPSQPVQGKIIS